jgi:hypothetical protein
MRPGEMVLRYPHWEILEHFGVSQDWRARSGQGNCIWNFLDIRVVEKARACLN